MAKLKEKRISWKMYDKMLEDYAREIGKKLKNLSPADRQRAFINGLMNQQRGLEAN